MTSFCRLFLPQKRWQKQTVLPDTSSFIPSKPEGINEGINEGITSGPSLRKPHPAPPSRHRATQQMRPYNCRANVEMNA